MQLNGLFNPDTNEKFDAVVYQMEIFPENPYCPMGHFNTEWSVKEENIYHMNLDLFPAVHVEEDLQMVREKMDRVADKYGRDRTKMREGLDVHYNMEHFPQPLATKVGCKLLNLVEKDLDLFIESYETFFDSYIEIIRKRKDTKFTEAERELKLVRNGRWLEYLTLKDGAVRMAQARGIPRQILIRLGYPPSAYFLD
jgi:coproporphyrinogen III oxidase